MEPRDHTRSGVAELRNGKSQRHHALSTAGLQVRGGIYSGAGDAFITVPGGPSSSRSVTLANQA